MRVTVLSENTPMGEFAGEHGLCLHVEHNNRSYLIDTGASALFAENAEKLGIRLDRVDAAFLSHAHFDHSGGYREFFAINKTAKVYLQKACRYGCYWDTEDTEKEYIGIPEGILESYGDRFVYVDGHMQPEEGVYICPHTTPGLAGRGEHARMYSKKGDITEFDDFSHEQTVVFEENDGLYLFNSCSHGGVENIIEEIRDRFPDREIRAFFGGFHMMGHGGTDTCDFSEKEVTEVAEKLKECGSCRFYTGHCTGSIAVVWLEKVLGERLIPLHSGMIIAPGC